MVTVKQGEIRITRPQIITPGNASPEFSNFFSEREEDGEGMLRFLTLSLGGLLQSENRQHQPLF